MTPTLLLPAAAVVCALIALTIGLRRVERELVELRTSLRRSGAAAVATDELRRSTASVAARAIALDADARQRVHRPRVRRPPVDR